MAIIVHTWEQRMRMTLHDGYRMQTKIAGSVEPFIECRLQIRINDTMYRRSAICNDVQLMYCTVNKLENTAWHVICIVYGIKSRPFVTILMSKIYSE